MDSSLVTGSIRIPSEHSGVVQARLREFFEALRRELGLSDVGYAITQMEIGDSKQTAAKEAWVGTPAEMNSLRAARGTIVSPPPHPSMRFQ